MVKALKKLLKADLEEHTCIEEAYIKGKSLADVRLFPTAGMQHLNFVITENAEGVLECTLDIAVLVYASADISIDDEGYLEEEFEEVLEEIIEYAIGGEGEIHKVVNSIQVKSYMPSPENTSKKGLAYIPITLKFIKN